MSVKIKRSVYADMFGPTTGDKVRLADTDLIIEVEKDFTTYGEEVKFGGGKVIRDGMGQSQVTNKQGAADTVITNALIVDHWGIVKADIGISAGRVQKIGKAGNPAIMDGVDPRLIDSEPTRDEIAPDHGREFGCENAFDVRPIAHSRSPNIAGGAVTPTPPSTGRIAPVV